MVIGPPQPRPYNLSTDADEPAATAATTVAATGDPCGQVVTLRVLPLAARQHLARDDTGLVQRRAERAEYYTRKAQLGFDRPGTALIDMAHTALHLADMPVSAALVDTGCDIAGISRPFYQRLCKEQGIQPSIGHVCMRGIVPGVSQCDMVVEPLQLTFNRGTTWEISLPWARWVILDNPALPDVLLDTSVVRALSLTILSDGTACYPLDVARGLHGPQAVVPFRTLGTAVESLHLEADLDAIGELPHSDPNKCYVFPLDAAGGKAGAVRAISSGYSGMGTVSFRMVEEGVHFENLQLIEANEERRQDLRKQLQLMHDLWPERLPDKVMQRAFDLGNAVGHDITQLTAELALDYMGQVDLVTLEPPCQDLSPLGMQLSIIGSRTELDLQGAALHELRMLFLKLRRGKTSQLMGVQIMSKARQRRLQEARARRPGVIHVDPNEDWICEACQPGV
eukprot:jgi/Tetstr1/427945/TSEL_001812.t1